LFPGVLDDKAIRVYAYYGAKELAKGVLGSISVKALLAMVRPSPRIGKNSKGWIKNPYTK